MLIQHRQGSVAEFGRIEPPLGNRVRNQQGIDPIVLVVAIEALHLALGTHKYQETGRGLHVLPFPTFRQIGRGLELGFCGGSLGGQQHERGLGGKIGIGECGQHRSGIAFELEEGLGAEKFANVFGVENDVLKGEGLFFGGRGNQSGQESARYKTKAQGFHTPIQNNLEPWEQSPIKAS